MDLFRNAETRREVFERLLRPTVEWGPALPEDKRRYSSTSSARKNHPSGDTLGDDDVFGEAGGAELVGIRPHDPEKVTFEDEVTVENGAATAQAEEAEEKPAENKSAEEEKLLEKKESEDPKV